MSGKLKVGAVIHEAGNELGDPHNTLSWEYGYHISEWACAEVQEESQPLKVVTFPQPVCGWRQT